jgi:putative spermidine/putrescine transport system ATP-binding protein
LASKLFLLGKVEKQDLNRDLGNIVSNDQNLRQPTVNHTDYLSLQGLSKSYGKVTALNDFNLSVAQGEFISLLGPSGCGKTTTLQLLAGFVQPSAGDILLNGKSITHLPPNERGLGIVFQSYALFPHMTVRENVSFGLEMRRMDAAERVERVNRILAMVQLDSYAERYPRDLSGGQRQRVALARAIVIEPPVLLLDEPLSNLDAKLREAMQFELRRIQRKLGTTTLMVTHDQAEALSISDRVVVMDNGRIQQIGAPHAVYESSDSRFVSTFVGKTNFLKATVRDRMLHLGSNIQIQINESLGPEGSELTLSIRPEKLKFALASDTKRLKVEIKERFFLGNLWLYRVESELGELEVSCINDGTTPKHELSTAHITWDDAHFKAMSSNEAMQ